MYALENSSHDAFEIDRPAEFASYFLHDRREILFYLNALAQRRIQASAHIDAGEELFLTSILAVNDRNNTLFLDAAQNQHANQLACAAKRITLTALLDRVKIQFRVGQAKSVDDQVRPMLAVAMPDSMLRLQRRDFFRLEPPRSSPVSCRLPILGQGTSQRELELILGDISGGGLSLIASTDHTEHFHHDAVFQGCRLEIPGENVLNVDLRVHKIIEISTQGGHHNLRVGCEFINLPGNRQTVIERYITRIERERKARPPLSSGQV